MKMRDSSLINTKAVILAGGRGERVRPVTDILPKALIPINGKPFIRHQLEQLQRIGIKEVIVLTGYLASSIQSYCEQLEIDLEITCVESDPEDSPAQRLLKSRSLIGLDFLIIYCDNFIVADSDIEAVLQSKSELTFLIEPREEGNITIGDTGGYRYIAGPRKSSNKFVELGNILVRSRGFMDAIEEIQDLPLALEKYSLEKECLAIKTTSGFLSISNLDRYLSLIKDRKIVLLDRDGVLIEKMPTRKYVTSFEEYKPMIDNWDGLKILGETGVDFIIATNQPGVATGDVEDTFLSKLHQRLVSELLAFGVNVIAVYVCKHHWTDNCKCRKPEPGMLLKAISDFRINKEQTLYIGDDDRDLIAAKAANIEGILVGLDNSSDFHYSNTLDALKSILFEIDTVE
jgi:histidinol-phosphate phosphatase family protein